MAEEEKKTIKLTEDQLVNAFSAARADLDSLQSRIGAAENYLREVLAATDALNAIKKSKEGEKIIVPLGAGVYIDAALDSNKAAKTSLAGSIVINNTIEEALKELEAKKQETEKAIAELQKTGERLVNDLNSLGSLLNRLEQKKQGQQRK